MKMMKPAMMKAPSLPGGPGLSVGTGPAPMPSGGHHGSVKPKLRTRHISVAGKSAFPNAGAAFGTPDATGPSPAAAFAGGSPGAGPGETGA